MKRICLENSLKKKHFTPESRVPIDNDYYDRVAAGWWDESQPLSMLLTGLNPGRFGYFRAVLTRRLGIEPRGATALDIGCGGGFQAEEFARLGCRVTGVDPSALTLEAARAHAHQSGLEIEYRLGAGEHLPADDAGFDIAYCCDVLEHVDDLERVIAETARALRPRGVYFFDTINRTVLSKLVAIKLMQEWKPTRVFDTNLHDWNRFIKPEELQTVLTRHDLHLQEVVGLVPGGKPLGILKAFAGLKRGTMTYGDLGRALKARAGKRTSISYMGYALRG
jgi:2-polyprenyl-6-hydroxyphenyl methylase/3-demethylubiquinone-9 3-methyltransferase